jgi:hypothetical protein
MWVSKEAVFLYFEVTGRFISFVQQKISNRVYHLHQESVAVTTTLHWAVFVAQKRVERYYVQSPPDPCENSSVNTLYSCFPRKVCIHRQQATFVSQVETSDARTSFYHYTRLPQAVTVGGLISGPTRRSVVERVASVAASSLSVNFSGAISLFMRESDILLLNSKF